MVGLLEDLRVQKVVSSNLTAPTLLKMVAISPMATIFFLILPIFIPILVIFGHSGLFSAVLGMRTIEGGIIFPLCYFISSSVDNSERPLFLCPFFPIPKWSSKPFEPFWANVLSVYFVDTNPTKTDCMSFKESCVLKRAMASNT